MEELNDLWLNKNLSDLKNSNNPYEKFFLKYVILQNMLSDNSNNLDASRRMLLVDSIKMNNEEDMQEYFEKQVVQEYFKDKGGKLKEKSVYNIVDIEKVLSNKELLNKNEKESTYLGMLYETMFSRYDKEMKMDFKCIKMEAFNVNYVRPEITICVSGFLSDGVDHVKEWKEINERLDKVSDVYYYNWCAESKVDIIKEGVSFLFPVFKWGGLLLDKIRGEEELNTIFKKATINAELCGKFLALIINERCLFKFQTINLIGFSLGCHVIKNCIKEVKSGIIGNVVFLGGATTLEEDIFSDKVAGRKINVFSKNDEILSKLFKIATGKSAVGLSKTDIMEDVDLGNEESFIIGHLDYRKNLNKIFDLIKY